MTNKSFHKLLASAILFLLIFQFQAFGQVPKKSLVNWMTLEEALVKQEKEPRTILLDAYTDWCGWCKVMDTTTFADPNIAGFINARFYPVKFNAEGFDTIMYRGKKYVNPNTGRRSSHELANELLNGRLSYPTLVYMDEKFNHYPVAGYLKPEQIEPILIYFSEQVNKSAPYDDFNKSFESVYRQQALPVDRINWISFEEAVEKVQKEPRKIIVSIYSGTIVSSLLYNATILTDSAITDYINQNYYAVKMLAERTDTVTVSGRTFVNELKMPNYPHQLPIALLNGEMYYPTLLMMDEKTMIINKVKGFINKTDTDLILHYFASNAYQSKTWDEFKTSYQKSTP